MGKILFFALVSSLCATMQAGANDLPEHRAELPAHGQPDPKAQSAAAAANDASIYLAQLRRCEGMHGQARVACVEAAKR
jgi:hypothetical protein